MGCPETWERLVTVSQGQGIWVSLPDKLLAQLDSVAEGAGISRDDAVRRAVEAFIGRSGGEELGAAMVRGYKDMARINLALAVDDEETLADWMLYEKRLSEADSSGGF